jgi:YegS/Rv2252/BmrU family lipid kinase
MRGLANDHPSYKDAVLIYNPYAGRLARRAHLLQRTIEQLAHQGVKARLLPTTGPNTAASLAQEEISKGAGLIVAAGGDGTINEVVNGMVGTNVPLAILPAGTANVLAHEIRMKASTLRTPDSLDHLVPFRVAVGRLRGAGCDRCFLAMAGVGLDAQIVYDLNLDLKASVGKLAYYISGFSHVFQRIPQFNVEIDGTTRRCGFALVSRVRNYGGDLEIARGASLLRDDFEVVLFEGENAFGYLRYLAGVALRRADKLKGVMVLRAKKVVCDCASDSRIQSQVDGELVCRLPIAMEIIPDALTLLVPKHYLEREQRLCQIAVHV